MHAVEPGSENVPTGHALHCSLPRLRLFVGEVDGDRVGLTVEERVRVVELVSELTLVNEGVDKGVDAGVSVCVRGGETLGERPPGRERVAVVVRDTTGEPVRDVVGVTVAARVRVIVLVSAGVPLEVGETGTVGSMEGEAHPDWHTRTRSDMQEPLQEVQRGAVVSPHHRQTDPSCRLHTGTTTVNTGSQEKHASHSARDDDAPPVVFVTHAGMGNVQLLLEKQLLPGEQSPGGDPVLDVHAGACVESTQAATQPASANPGATLAETETDTLGVADTTIAVTDAEADAELEAVTLDDDVAVAADVGVEPGDPLRAKYPAGQAAHAAAPSAE